MTPRTFGEFVEIDGGNERESLSLRFSPSSVPLKQRWRNNGLSADFLADYVTTFLPRSADPARSEARQLEVRGAVSYIANELLENAMKYSSDMPSRSIAILLHLGSDLITFQAANSMATEQADQFRDFIERLRASDPVELYTRQLEDPTAGGSGVGLLTMVNDYGATLAWRFVPAADDTVTVTTQVRLRI
jgi:hypothetical protein